VRLFRDPRACIYNGVTVSDLHGLPEYPGLRRRCPVQAGPRVWRETAMPPVLGKETKSRSDAACPTIVFPLPTRTSRSRISRFAFRSSLKPGRVPAKSE